MSEIKIHCKFDKMEPFFNLKPNPKNPHKHSPEQIERLAELVKYQGVRHPVIVSKRSGFIVVGHGRMEAFKLAGLNLCPVVYQDFPSDEAEFAFITSDNAIGKDEWAQLDLSMITDVVKDFDDFNTDMLGFLDFDLTPEIIPQADEDEVPESAPTVTVLGDLYELGNHRLMCGDSTSVDAVEKLMDGKVANIMMTDPPYGVELDQSWRDKALGQKALGNGNSKVVSNDDRADWTDVWSLFRGNIAYVWHAGKFTDVVMKSLRDADLEPNQQLIWNKSVMVMGRCDYHFKHEPCWYAVRKGKTHDWIGDRKQTTIIEAAPPDHIMGGSKEDKTPHPTQKPVVCMELIKNNSGDVYDPFGGSGSTLIACEKTNRKCFMMELDPHYVDIIVSRWCKYTGQTKIKRNGQEIEWQID